MNFSNNSNESAMADVDCPFTITPIDKMEFIQQNFVKYKNGDRAAAEFVGQERITLSKRFTLMERGFLLQLKEDSSMRQSHFEGMGCTLKCEKPVYAKEVHKMKRSTRPEGRTGRKNSGETKPTTACDVPFTQMQNMNITD